MKLPSVIETRAPVVRSVRKDEARVGQGRHSYCAGAR